MGASESTYDDVAYTWGDCREWASFEPVVNDNICLPYAPGLKLGQDFGMALFSSHGPCTDGRIKPDIVAPGSWVKSAAAHPMYKPSKEVYALLGTSMSAPCVAGICACIRQHLKNGMVENPSAALVKAVLLNGAHQMGIGQYGTEYQEIPAYSPNHVCGFGLADIQQSLFPTNGVLLVKEGAVEQDETAVFLARKSEEGPVSVTLCWSDPPAEPYAAQTLINDLDIQFFDGKTTYYANGLTEPNDSINNAEIIRLPNVPASEHLEIRVYGRTIMDECENQTFALAVNGLDAFIPEPAGLGLLLSALGLLARKRRQK